jgi:Zn ribbon nucleic-acid-binding protein
MSLLVIPDNMGWGNVLMCICYLLAECNYENTKPYVHESINKVLRGVDFSGFEITSDMDMKRCEPKIFLNQKFFNSVHRPFMRKIIKPTEQMQKLIEQNKHLVEGVKCGFHIRRGAFSKDSSQIGCHGREEDGSIKPAYFASEEALQKFEKIVDVVPGRIYIASDSKSLKEWFKAKFGPEKITYLDTDIALTYNCDVIGNGDHTKDDDRLNCYLDWFLLSMCENLYLTGGKDGMDMSTYGYTAAVYGECGINFITN